MDSLLIRILEESWHVLVEASPYVLLGFFFAGLIKAFVPDSTMARHLGGKSFFSVVKAAVIGVPLPLCSCGVLPTALGMRKQGASKGSTTAFMISTPETGVDSMAVTYALIDPIMTVVRPIAASVTAIFAGVMVNLFPEKEKPADRPLEPLKPIELRPLTGEPCCDSVDRQSLVSPSKIDKFRAGMGYAFGEMIAYIGRWLLLGVVVAGVITAVIPDNALDHYLGAGIMSYLVMLTVALPLYVCATASTPIAASLLLKGVSPGAALVFLLAGPATNGATITVMLKTMGKRAAGLYVFSIVVCSLALAYAVDALYASLGLNIVATVSEVEELLPEWMGVASAGALLLLVAKSYVRPPQGGG